MNNPAVSEFFTFDSTLSPHLLAIGKKVISGERITIAEGLALYSLYSDGELGFLGALANHVRERKNGNVTFFNRNFHIEPTNICVFSCKFCSYSRTLKEREAGWELSKEDILKIVRSYEGQPVTEVHIVKCISLVAFILKWIFTISPIS
jgi:aminodeoxyfutalosine synthase